MARRARARDATSNRVAQQFGVNWQRGKLPELIGDLEALAGHSGPRVTWSAALAFSLAEAARVDEARVILDELTAGDCDLVGRGLLWLTSIALLAETCARVGTAAQAESLRRLLLPHRARFVQVGYMTCFGSVERVLGLLAARAGEQAVAANHFDEAVERNSQIDAEAIVAMTARDRERAFA